ncbi:MAG TPA: hypothetical protein DD433_12455, partial [Ruminococcaceae bacterium]|nr:hypothetical protein [Oscillospiraceae bacterium]
LENPSFLWIGQGLNAAKNLLFIIYQNTNFYNIREWAPPEGGRMPDSSTDGRGPGQIRKNPSGRHPCPLFSPDSW